MKWIVCILIALMLAGSSPVGSLQLMFIYTDNKPHDPPADVARIPVIHIESSQTAYAGATWIKLNEQTPLKIDGKLDKSYAYRWADKVYPARHFFVMSSFEHCITWDVRPSDEFDEFLEENGYRRAEIKDETIEVNEIIR